MPDIVKRLREVNGGWVPDMALDAADEIDRLRQQVRHANDHADAAIKDMELIRTALTIISNAVADEIGIKGCAHIARAALEESK